MKTILRYLGITKTAQGDKSPVYVFFAEADAKTKAKAYRKALRGASADQKDILTKYEKKFVHTN